MKSNKKALTIQRRALDQKLKFELLQNIPIPKRGWIKAVREALMMTSGQLAARMGIAQAAVMNMEKREGKKKVTLETIERAATAMNCRLVYVLIPLEGSLEKTLDEQALRVATQIAKPITHSMSLENQSVLSQETQAQIQDLAQELKFKGDKRIWSSENRVPKKK